MLRSLNQADVSRLREINSLSLGYHVSEELVSQQLTRLTTDNHHFFIGFADEARDELLGYVHAQVYESLYSETGLNVLGLAVHPDAQGKGIGRQLMTALEKQAKERGYSFIRLNSGSQRIAAHAFYKASGYDGDKTQKRFIKFL